MERPRDGHRDTQWIRRLLVAFGAPLAVALSVSWVLMYFPLHRIEAKFYDWRMIFKGETRGTEDVTVVPVHGRLSFRDHIKALESMIAMKPRAIAYVKQFESQLVSEEPELAKEFVSLASRAQIGSKVKVYLSTDIDLSGEVLPVPPLNILPRAVAVIYKESGIFAEDKVTRRALTYLENEPTLHVLLASLVTGNPPGHVYRGTGTFGEVNIDYIFINYAGDSSKLASGYQQVEFNSFLDGSARKDDVTGKVLLIGSIASSDSTDFAYTPWSRTPFDNPKLYIHASIVGTLIRDNGLFFPSKFWDFFITFLFSLAMIFVALKTPPAKGIGIMLFTTFAFLALAFVSFKFLYVSINCIHPLLGIFFAYYIFVPYRAITESKIRFIFQKKHEVLQQVDELKSNFLSFISHDLKTPVARIQGLADILLSRADLPRDQQKAHLSEINRSADELNHFISSILNLAKIEANRIKLQKSSRDVNIVVEECVSKLKFHAGEKRITLDLRLEPLFPIRIDTNLLGQVFTNLIENAIKYSPEGTTVTVASREEDSWIIIEVRDEGFGMDEADVQNAFTKFYRGKNPATTNIKGSGLGLYLVRYFVELHKGTIALESAIGKGSVFTVRLPLNEEA